MTSSRRQFLGAAAALATLPATSAGEDGDDRPEKREDLKEQRKESDTITGDYGYGTVNLELEDVDVQATSYREWVGNGWYEHVSLSIEGYGISLSATLSFDEARKLGEELVEITEK